MSHRLISDDIISTIDELQKKLQGKEATSTSNDNQEDKYDNGGNTIVGIVTPEWYYSDSTRIFSDVDLNWDSLEKFDLVHNMAENLYRIDADTLPDGEFEKSFSSWYQSYHHLPRTKWGIHVRYDSWFRIAAKFSHNCPSLVSKALNSVKAAFLFLFTHSLFHYIVENAASIIEILLAKPDIYKTYFSNVYAEIFNSPECIEESLANAYLFERHSICHIDKNYLEEELSRQGPGYRDFVDYTDSRFRNGARKLMLQIHHGTVHPNSDAPLEQIIDVRNPIDYSHGHRVPIWLHRRAKPLHQTKNILGNM